MSARSMERLRRCSAAHLHTTGEAKKMMMRSRLGELLLRRDADTTEPKAHAASKMALPTRLERGAVSRDAKCGVGVWQWDTSGHMTPMREACRARVTWTSRKRCCYCRRRAGDAEANDAAGADLLRWCRYCWD